MSLSSNEGARGNSRSESPPEHYSPSSSESESRQVDDSPNTAPKSKAKRRKYVRDPIQRKKILEDDIWATNITVTSVDCQGCGKTLALDGRRQYYLGLWEKHRVKCAGIRRQKGEEPLPRKPRKTAPKHGGEVNTSNVSNTNLERHTRSLQRDDFTSRTASTSSILQSHNNHYRANSADIPDETKHSTKQPHYRLPVSRSMESLQPNGPDQPGNEWYWRETPFAPPISNESPRGRAVYRYSTRWELANNFGKYQAGPSNLPEQEGGSGAQGEK